MAAFEVLHSHPQASCAQHKTSSNAVEQSGGYEEFE